MRRGGDVSGRLDAFEQLLEGAVEGTALRLFRPRLEPAHLGRAAARQMERRQLVGPDGPSVPNDFVYRLHPSDFARFESFQTALERQLSDYLTRYAADRDWRTFGPVRVRLESDETVRRGRPSLTAELRDSPPEPTPEQAVPGGTAVLPRVQAELKQLDAANGRLVTEDGQSFELRRPITSIGRALENDIVITDSRISRFHLELCWEQGEYRFRDLGSTNGTRIAEKAEGRQTLRDGDVLLLGGYRLVFHQG
jgi:hypothetical protein